MQALKLLVAGLGMLIVISMGLLGWGFYTKFKAPQQAGDASPGVTGTPPAPGAGPLVPAAAPLVPAAAPLVPAAAPMVPAAAPMAAFGEIRLPLPAGCTAVEMQPTADRLYVRTGPTGLCERIYVFDNGGRLLGSIVLAP